MYLVETKTILVTALKDTFATYPVAGFENLYVSIEFPYEQANYPAIWIDFSATSLETVGVAHTENVPVSAMGTQVYHRWIFDGQASFTIAALSSLERDRLSDEFVRIVAASDIDPTLAVTGFRYEVENNDLVGLRMNWDSIGPSGQAATPGTPWGSDQMMYEITYTMECNGEFLTNTGANPTLARLSNVKRFFLPPGAIDPTLAELDPAGWI